MQSWGAQQSLLHEQNVPRSIETTLEKKNKIIKNKKSLLSIKRPDRKHFMKEVRIVVPIAQMLIAA